MRAKRADAIVRQIHVGQMLMMIISGKQTFSWQFSKIVAGHNKRVQIWVYGRQSMMKQFGGRLVQIMTFKSSPVTFAAAGTTCLKTLNQYKKR